MSFVIVAAALMALGGSSPQTTAPQTPPPPQTVEPAQLEEVVVESRTLSETVDRFVDDIIAAPVGRGPARWDRTVCVGVVNLRRDAAQVIIDEVSAVAVQVGLEIGEPGCSPNILVIAADDGQAMARSLVDARRRAFRPGYSGAARSVSALDQFQDRQAPVRWWHVSIPVEADSGAVAVKIPGYDPPLVRQDASRLRTNIRNELRRAFVIVDLTQATGVTFQQLGQYIGMVTMAQIDPDADTAPYDTVLNLFDRRQSVAGLTPWDVSYLQSLYAAELNRRAVSQQAGEVSGIMLRDQRAQQEETPED